MTDQHKGHRLEAAAESTAVKVIARFGMPIMLGLIAYFGSEQLKELKQNSAEQSRAIADLRVELRVLGTRLDEGVIRQVNENSRQLDNHEERLRVLERTTGTP